jgi:hypothetical protein
MNNENVKNLYFSFKIENFGDIFHIVCQNHSIGRFVEKFGEELKLATGVVFIQLLFLLQVTKSGKTKKSNFIHIFVSILQKLKPRISFNPKRVSSKRSPIFRPPIFSCPARPWSRDPLARICAWRNPPYSFFFCPKDGRPPHPLCG